MKTIGLLGGMSWESTLTYYQVLNEYIKRELGGLHSAKILLHSVDFSEIEAYQSNGDWENMIDVLSQAAAGLEHAGADFLVICSNTIHKVAPQIQERIGIPIIHIAEAAADELKRKNMNKVALLGTKYTMEQHFFKEKLEENGISALIPDRQEIEAINNIIFSELCLGIRSDASKSVMLDSIDRLARNGAQGVVLACTEIGLLIKQEDVSLPVFDTTQIHAAKAAKLSLE